MTHDLDALVPVTPVTPVAFHILLALATGERHGYAIMDATALSAGTVYRMIKHLVAAGLVTPAMRPTSTSDDERRRYDRLTPQGRAVAQAATAAHGARRTRARGVSHQGRWRARA